MVLEIGPAAVVDQLSVLPTERRVALRLLWLLDDPHTPLDEIGRVIAADPGLSARVLSVANAPYYGAPGAVATVTRAVTLLGMTAVRTLATTSALELFSAREVDAPEGFWLHSLTTAVAAASVASHVNVVPSEAQVAGLLHDAGVAWLRARDANAFDDIARGSDGTDQKRLVAEVDEFGTDHADHAAQAFAALGLPARIVDAIRLHHSADHSSPRLARVVLAADRIAHAVVDRTGNVDRPIAPALHALELSADLEPQLVTRAAADQRAVLDFLANFLSVGVESNSRS